ncbi:MAG: DUF4286 family protein [Saprospiraceae bacterium]|nr:DUF4286 family protein [Bacteroidia bacterium]NNE14834.1 DUF4286 family protein [Saprospiraceae bacterium]NNL90607.1 DUF4286 family protein [Saprospiraceae bacterium]
MQNPIVFNITIKIEKTLSKDWLTKMQNDYLPPCIDGQIITGTQINFIHLNEQDDDDTFAVQFTFANGEKFEHYKLTSMQKFLNLLDQDYRGKYVYFTTKMERVFSSSLINK